MKAVLLNSLSEAGLGAYMHSEFYEQHVLQSYQYTDTSLRYYQEYFGDQYQDHSIVVFNESDEPLLAVYAYSNKNILTHFEGPLAVIEGKFQTESEKQQAYRALILKLNEQLKAHSFHKVLFYENPFLLAEYYSKTEHPQTELASCIDLGISNTELKANIRKSYKSLVNWGEKNLRVVLIDHRNANHEQFISFRDFHIHTAGRRTRSDQSWELQFESILKNEAYLVLAYLEERLVSGTLVLYGKTKAYYGVGVYDRELMAQNIAVAHYNMLYAIYHAKEIGLSEFDLGHLNAGSDQEKEINIFRFKSGFSNEMTSRNKFTAVFNHIPS